jgi:hypothetical protein
VRFGNWPVLGAVWLAVTIIVITQRRRHTS